MALSIALQSRLCSNVALNNLTGDVASSGRKVTPRPHRRHPAQDGVLLAEMMGRESFTLLDHLCGRIGRPDTHKEVYVIGLNRQLHKLPPAFSALLFDKCTTVLRNGATQHRLTALGTPDQVVDDKVDAVFISLVFHVDIVAYNNTVIYKDRLFEGRLKPGKAPNLWGSIPEACGGLKSVSVTFRIKWVQGPFW
jgi:hypothetical protein